MPFCSCCWTTGGGGCEGRGWGEAGQQWNAGTVGQYVSSLPSSKAETVRKLRPALGLANGKLVFMSVRLTSVSQALLVTD